MNFEENFRIYMDVKDTVEIPEKLYKVTERRILERSKLIDSYVEQGLTLLDLYERLEYLPHDNFFIQIADSGYIDVNRKDGLLTIKSTLRIQDKTGRKQKQGYLCQYSSEHHLEDRIHKHQSFDFKDELNRSILFYLDTDFIPISIKERQLRHEIVLMDLLSTLEIIFQRPEQVEVAEVHEFETEEEFLEKKISKIEDSCEYIVTTWRGCNQYQTSDRARRREIQNLKRLHAVAGHWRYYRTGKRVWIKSHKRGNEAVGSLIVGVIV